MTPGNSFDIYQMYGGTGCLYFSEEVLPKCLQLCTKTQGIKYKSIVIQNATNPETQLFIIVAFLSSNVRSSLDVSMHFPTSYMSVVEVRDKESGNSNLFR